MKIHSSEPQADVNVLLKHGVETHTTQEHSTHKNSKLSKSNSGLGHNFRGESVLTIKVRTELSPGMEKRV